MNSNGVPVPPNRASAARDVADALTSAHHVVLTTHVNADGDGVGSEIGLWYLLRARGVSVTIANPTEIPERFHFLIPAGADATDRAAREMERADLVASLDIGDLSRLGNLATVISKRHLPLVCIDHHVGPVKLPAGPCLIAPEATATAELVFDLASVAGWPLTAQVAQALYVGLLTGTVEFPRSIAGVRLALLFRYIGNGRVKISFRSMGEVDVAALAHQFGGGGHHRAAGASLPGTMAEVEEQVLSAARAFLANGKSA